MQLIDLTSQLKPYVVDTGQICALQSARPGRLYLTPLIWTYDGEGRRPQRIKTRNKELHQIYRIHHASILGNCQSPRSIEGGSKLHGLTLSATCRSLGGCGKVRWRYHVGPTRRSGGRSGGPTGGSFPSGFHIALGNFGPLDPVLSGQPSVAGQNIPSIRTHVHDLAVLSSFR
jgi:hypothetical protein